MDVVQLLPLTNTIQWESFLQGRRDGSSQDEPFAWQSKEFLRQLCIGQVKVLLHSLLTSLADLASS